MTVTRSPACPVKWCPARSDPDWHRCWICGALATEHHHVKPARMGGSKSRKKDPQNIVALCHPHHEAVTMGEMGCGINHVPGRGLVFWAWDLQGKTIAERILEAGNAGAEPEDTFTKVPSGRTSPIGTAEVPEPLEARSEGQNSASAPPASGESSAGELGATTGSCPVPTQPGSPALFSQLTHDERMGIAAEIRREQKQRQWKAGDTANAWEAETTEAWQYLDEFGYTHPALSNIMHICENIPASRRRESLSFAHHAVIHTYNAEDQEARLDRCEQEGWTVREFREAVHGSPVPKVPRWTYAQLEEYLCGRCRASVSAAMEAK